MDQNTSGFLGAPCEGGRGTGGDLRRPNCGTWSGCWSWWSPGGGWVGWGLCERGKGGILDFGVIGVFRPTLARGYRRSLGWACHPLRGLFSSPSFLPFSSSFLFLFLSLSLPSSFFSTSSIFSQQQQQQNQKFSKFSLSSPCREHHLGILSSLTLTICFEISPSYL